LDREDEIIRIALEREDDGRWMAEAPDLPGVMAYGKTGKEALAKVQSPTSESNRTFASGFARLLARSCLAVSTSMRNFQLLTMVSPNDS